MSDAARLGRYITQQMFVVALQTYYLTLQPLKCPAAALVFGKHISDTHVCSSKQALVNLTTNSSL